MKKIILSLTLVVLFQQLIIAQNDVTARASGLTKFVYGIRAGLNLSRITNGSALGATHRTGLVAGLFADQSFGKCTGMREEISYISSGFKFKNSNSQGNVSLQYFYLTHLFTFNLGRIVQLHAGPQTGLLINAIADSINRLNESSVGRYFSVNNRTNRFIYGGCAGLEIYPYKGLLFGLRYNLSFSAINRKELTGNYTYQDNNVYSANNNNSRLKNEMWQIVIGWRFGCGINQQN
jgi:hypothetical protein